MKYEKWISDVLFVMYCGVAKLLKMEVATGKLKWDSSYRKMARHYGSRVRVFPD